ncbi:MAG: hypothetical protein ACI8SR_003407 [Oceanicoccus sp.]|jgi:hypothetical protein
MSPLDQLKDIHLPQAVSYWPPAWPWWLLLFSVIALVVLFCLHKKRQAWRKQAIKQVDAIDWQAPDHAYRDANKLLKQISMQKIDSRCANLSGEAWLNFLDTQLKQSIFMPELRPFAHILDEPNIQLDPHRLQHAIKHWIRKVKC